MENILAVGGSIATALLAILALCNIMFKAALRAHTSTTETASAKRNAEIDGNQRATDSSIAVINDTIVAMRAELETTIRRVVKLETVTENIDRSLTRIEDTIQAIHQELRNRP